MNEFLDAISSVKLYISVIHSFIEWSLVKSLSFDDYCLKQSCHPVSNVFQRTSECFQIDFISLCFQKDFKMVLIDPYSLTFKSLSLIQIVLGFFLYVYK